MPYSLDELAKDIADFAQKLPSHLQMGMTI